MMFFRKQITTFAEFFMFHALNHSNDQFSFHKTSKLKCELSHLVWSVKIHVEQ